MNQRLTVLIIEDSQDDYLLLKEVIESSEDIEATILHETRLQHGLSVAGEKAVDVAIIDLSLPDSFGLETFLSFHGQQPLMPVIIMTGARDHEMAFEAVRKGAQDYLFKGDLSAAGIIRCIRYAIERQRLTTELKIALDHVRQLQGMLPICSICKSIRDDKGYWNKIESYFSEHSDVLFSHGLCPKCAQRHYPEFYVPEDEK
jgi:DNA-binding NtrC family response regulator